MWPAEVATGVEIGMKEVLVMVSVVVETSVTVEAGMEVVQSCQCLVDVEL